MEPAALFLVVTFPLVVLICFPYGTDIYSAPLLLFLLYWHAVTHAEGHRAALLGLPLQRDVEKPAPVGPHGPGGHVAVSPGQNPPPNGVPASGMAAAAFWIRASASYLRYDALALRCAS